MSTVLNFDPSRRTTSSNGTGFLICECSSAYFHLVRLDAEGNEVPGVVTLRADGSLGGYSGTPRCSNCGRDKAL